MKTKRIIFSVVLLVMISGCTGNQATYKTKPPKPSKQTQAHGSLSPHESVDGNVNYSYSPPDGMNSGNVKTEMSAPAQMTLSGTPSMKMAQHQSPAIGINSSQMNLESYNNIEENGFINCVNDSLSTFSIDVDTASYSNIRRFIKNDSLPPVGAIRLEEMINYFSYNYPAPQGEQPLTISTEAGPSPYNNDYSLIKIGIKAKDINREELPPSNLVFLIDVSGSMNSPGKLPLLKKAMRLLVDNLSERDRVAIVTYAGHDTIALDSTPVSQKEKILAAIDEMNSAGSTHASKGIETAYDLAARSFIHDGNNRIILASDGDFNIGVTSRGELTKLIEKKRNQGIYLTVLGLGMGNYHDDTMEILADKGNGNYGYIDSLLEAKKILVKEMGGTLFTVAKDVKIQVEFNPALVGAYRLIGYENRALADEDFIDDTKDAGEIGAGHRVTALYEIIPAGHKDVPKVDSLKYQQPVQPVAEDLSSQLLTVKVRYKPENETSSKEISHILALPLKSMEQTSNDFRFAAAVAGYGMLLRGSALNKDMSWKDCLELIRRSRGQDNEGYRAELLRIVEKSELLASQK